MWKKYSFKSTGHAVLFGNLGHLNGLVCLEKIMQHLPLFIAMILRISRAVHDLLKKERALSKFSSLQPGEKRFIIA
ncbi:hypothetical protein A4H97_15870 [Niastella yeongjuensis]|uniref:Uncharacterized protein n=1 Tax=Niastella yeongjuensis TaxID=354355 RepID=A0A1V9E4W6_9BACT|nr:hypothetical protein A4H97_15870 [Niastella yeongjuensis]